LVGIENLVKDNPAHPYGIAGIQSIEESLVSFVDYCQKTGYPMQGSLDKNWLLPSAMGAFRPTCLAPEMMVAGDLRTREPMLIVGFEQLADFYPQLIADNLSLQGVLCHYLILDLPQIRDRRTLNPMILAILFDSPEFRAEVIATIKSKLGESGRIGFPAVLIWKIH
jgi:glycerol-3-phosphate dehydrogenase subunit B